MKISQFVGYIRTVHLKYDSLNCREFFFNPLKSVEEIMNIYLEYNFFQLTRNHMCKIASKFASFALFWPLHGDISLEPGISQKNESSNVVSTNTTPFKFCHDVIIRFIY